MTRNIEVCGGCQEHKAIDGTWYCCGLDRTGDGYDVKWQADHYVRRLVGQKCPRFEMQAVAWKLGEL